MPTLFYFFKNNVWYEPETRVGLIGEARGEFLNHSADTYLLDIIVVLTKLIYA